MGLLSTLFGSNRLKKANREQYFAITTASISFEGREDIHITDSAGLVFNPVESSFFATLDTEIRDLMNISTRETGSTFEIKTDEFGTRWVVVHDPDFEDLVTTLHMIGEVITDHGFGDRLLAAVFRIDFEGARAYWVYNIKRGRYYPLVLKGDRQRDNHAEMRLGTMMEKEKLPVEPTLEQWYALWGIPF
jgi:hypothetical protein